ncbi:cyclic di-AMP binding protein CbpA [Ectobacillus antri]|jgi:CBS domain-containing protein|uniref:Cyclic di-AMP binding protein CbpA n=1 Tax=Ectobacillus antri TaxID=2486280 RepID=A0ABT6H526_9BACI|nr:cyclic di-AMP binding protein CbpA [Ectobacillus antri]MDG4657442.1 cyclic di-AMP binding protein CbpA [Ectobacillus antri]MDG5753755.1 cyclic di-AMP binding protein CbpA [Ectobacillus antri]
MRVKYHFIPKKQVVSSCISNTVESTLELMNQSGYRCIPTLDESKKSFLGLIYKVDLLEFLYNGGDHENTIVSLVEDAEAFVFERDSFFRAFYTIRRLPFLGVLDDHHEFLGILTHANIFDVLEDSFGMNTGGYTLTIATHENKGTIKELGSVLRNYNIGGLLTLDNGDKYVRRLIVNITDELSTTELEKLITKLEKKDFRVSRVDKI